MVLNRSEFALGLVPVSFRSEANPTRNRTDDVRGFTTLVVKPDNVTLFVAVNKIFPM